MISNLLKARICRPSDEVVDAVTKLMEQGDL